MHTRPNHPEMVSYYSHRKDGLPCCLREVCPRPLDAPAPPGGASRRSPSASPHQLEELGAAPSSRHTAYFNLTPSSLHLSSSFSGQDSLTSADSFRKGREVWVSRVGGGCHMRSAGTSDAGWDGQQQGSSSSRPAATAPAAAAAGTQHNVAAFPPPAPSAPQAALKTNNYPVERPVSDGGEDCSQTYSTMGRRRDCPVEHLPELTPSPAAGQSQCAAGSSGSGGGGSASVLENCDLFLHYQLGVGNFGVVMQGVLRNMETGKERSVAVKILREEKDSGEVNRQQMLQEAKVMAELNHPNVIKLIGIFNGPELMLVSELAPLGQLNKYLRKNRAVPGEMLMNYALQVAAGMAYLEKRSFVHRDLAARNVLLVTERHARISDFGMSRMLNYNKDYYRANDGGHWPVRWYAPQCIYFFTFTSKSDVWSYGITLWEVFSHGARPYGGMTSGDILSLIDKGGRLKCPDSCPKEMYSLMLRCWEYDEDDRPTFQEIHQVVEVYFRAHASMQRRAYPR